MTYLISLILIRFLKENIVDYSDTFGFDFGKETIFNNIEKQKIDFF